MVATGSSRIGIIPVTNPGELGTPYPSELYTVEKGKLLIHYALDSLYQAGIYEAMIVAPEKILAEVARAVGYESYGVAIRYLAIPSEESTHYNHLFVRAARRAMMSEGFEEFIAVNPVMLSKFYNPAKVLLDESNGCIFREKGIWRCDREQLKAFRREVKVDAQGAEERIGLEFRPHTLIDFINLSTFKGIYEFWRL